MTLTPPLVKVLQDNGAETWMPYTTSSSSGGGLPGVVVVNGFNAAAINAAIQQAEANASSGGAAENGCLPIFFPPGRYKADAAIVVAKSGHTWFGSGQRSCTIESAIPNAPMVRTSNPANDGIVGFKVFDLGFENVLGLPGVSALDLTGHRHWSLVRVLVGWMSGAGVYLSGGTPLNGAADNMFGLIDNCIFENATSGSPGEIFADPVGRGAGYLTVRDSQFNGDTSHPQSSLGIVGVLPSCELHGNKFEGVYQPFDIQGQGVFIDRNVMEIPSGGPMVVRLRANGNSWPGGINYSTIAAVFSRNQYQTYGQPSQFKLVVDSGCTDVYQQLDGNPAGNPFLISRKLA